MSTRTALQPATPPEGAILLTFPEAAFVLRCSVSHVYKELAAGRLARRKSGRKSFVHRDDLRAYLDASRRIERPPAERQPPADRVSLRAAGLWDGDDFGAKSQRGRPKAKG